MTTTTTLVQAPNQIRLPMTTTTTLVQAPNQIRLPIVRMKMNNRNV